MALVTSDYGIMCTLRINGPDHLGFCASQSVLKDLLLHTDSASLVMDTIISAGFENDDWCAPACSCSSFLNKGGAPACSCSSFLNKEVQP